MTFWGLRVGLATTLLVGSLGAANASAKPTFLHLKTLGENSRTVEVGDYLEGESSGGPTIESASGTETCGGGTFVGIYGRLLSNNEKTDKWNVLGGKRSFEGGACTGSFPVGGEVHQHWVGEKELGLMTLTSKGKALFTSNSAAHATLELTSSEAGHFCAYSLKKLKGIARYGTGEPAEVSFNKQKMKLTGHNIENCPKTATITVSFALKTALKGSSEAEEHFAFTVIEGVVS